MKRTVNLILVILAIFVVALIYIIGFEPELLNVRSASYTSWVSFSILIALSSAMLFLSYILYQKAVIYQNNENPDDPEKVSSATLFKGFKSLITFGIGILLVFVVIAFASIGFLPHFGEANDQAFYSNFILFTVFGLAVGLFVYALTVQKWWNNMDPKRVVERKKVEEKVAVLEKKMGKKLGKLTLFEKILQVRPTHTDVDVAMGHNYDGIEELDNPPPPWFMFLFYGSILAAIIYFSVYILGSGLTQEQEYEAELKQADIAQAKYLAEAGDLVDETNVTYNEDAAFLKEGEAIYNDKCVACHLEDGGGSIGPNLTDKYWIHGGGIKEVFSTIKYGVTAKGMQSWKNLGAANMHKVSSYVLSLQGTTPANPKEPEGELWQPVVSSDTSAVVLADSAVTE